MRSGRRCARCWRAPRGRVGVRRAAGIMLMALVQSASAVTVAAIGFVDAGLLSLAQVLWVLFLGIDVLRDAFTGLAADAHRPGYYFSRTKSSGTWHLAAMRVATEPSTADSSAPWPCEPNAIRSSLFFAAYAAI